jgi:mannitol-specific phosphotransferase system IIBC component
MKTKQLPLLIMLLAGAAVSISTKLMGYELETALWILLGTLIVFYIMGCLMKRTIDSFERELEAAAEQEKEAAAEEGEAADGNAQEADAAEGAEETVKRKNPQEQP